MKKYYKEQVILLTGGSGFVGSNFLGYMTVSKKNKYRIIGPSHKELDILNVRQLHTLFSRYNPDIVINFAAHRDANSAEEQRGDKQGSVWQTNVVGVSNISKICKKYNCFFIHISTDMVFSGKVESPGPYAEETKRETKLKNLSWYGWSKAESERIVQENDKSAIIRIGNVTKPISDPGLDYIGKILSLYDRGQLYGLFYDQYLTLTPIPLLFTVIEELIRNPQYGVFHVATNSTFTPFELGKYLVRRARGKSEQIQGVSIDDFLAERPNRYPKYGGLLAHETARRLHIRLPEWKKIVDQSVPYFVRE